LSQVELTRRQQKRRERLQRVQGWQREKVQCTREEEVNKAWHEHKAFLINSDQGNAATSAGVLRGNNQNGKQRA
jgi:hypothetical protein